MEITTIILCNITHLYVYFKVSIRQHSVGLLQRSDKLMTWLEWVTMRVRCSGKLWYRLEMIWTATSVFPVPGGPTTMVSPGCMPDLTASIWVGVKGIWFLKEKLNAMKIWIIFYSTIHRKFFLYKCTYIPFHKIWSILEDLNELDTNLLSYRYKT